MCVQFWYHLYGRDAGYLRVFLEIRDHQPDEVWSTSGDHGNHWFYGQVAMETNHTKEVRVSCWKKKINVCEWEVGDRTQGKHIHIVWGVTVSRTVSLEILFRVAE